MKYSAKHYAGALFETLRGAKDDAEFSRRARAFLGMLRKHKTSKLLPSILKKVEELAREKSVEVLTAKKLPQEILEGAKKAFGSEYAVREKAAPELIGGAVFMWDDWRIDGSIRGRLRKLRSTPISYIDTKNDHRIAEPSTYQFYRIGT